jgi:hypothetical protein
VPRLDQPPAQRGHCESGLCLIYPATGRQRYLSHTVPDDPAALADAEAAWRRLVS